MHTFHTHFSILPQEQRELWPLLAPTASLGGILYGGTALALRFGHRKSVDFDFFFHNPFDDIDIFYKPFPFLKKGSLIQCEKNTFSFLTEQGVKLSFFGGIRFGCVQEPEMTEDGVLCVASVLDIMATKLYALLKRVAAKDYMDIATMLHHGTSIEEGLSAALALYGDSFPIMPTLRTLTYFEGNDVAALPQAYKNILIAASQNCNGSKIRKLPLWSPHLPQG